MSPKTVRTVAIVLLVVAAVSGAAIASYALQQRRVAELESQLAARDDAIETLTAKMEALNSQLASVDTSPAEVPSASQAGQGAQPDAAAPAPPAEPTVSRQFAFVRKATNKNGKVSLVLDFAQFLTGTAAAEAAAAAGDEPPPNDYYIANDNPKLRTFSVAEDAKFIVAAGDPEDTKTLSAAGFYTAIKNDVNGAKDAPYWFTISNGVVTAGEEEWLP